MKRLQNLRIASPALFLALVLPAFFLSGCVTQRTVTQNGRVVSEGPVIKRPVRDAINRSR